MKRKKNLYLTGTYILLTVLAVIWLIPIIWIFLTSFRGEGANAVPYFFPKTYTFNNYIKLFTSDAYPFGKWFINTFIVATCTCILSTLITVGMAYSLSRIKFKHRNGFLKLALVLNMFPGFMSMIAVYYILKALNLTQTLTSLVLVYSAGAALGFYIAKGFFDTIPYSLDESAMIDGATRLQIFTKITLPLSKPIIVLHLLSSVTLKINIPLPLDSTKCLTKTLSMNGSFHLPQVLLSSPSQSPFSLSSCRNTMLKV